MPRRGTRVGVVLVTLAWVVSAGCLGSDPGPAACRAATDCSNREFCARPIGACDQAGTCRPRPEICLQTYAPVCGCDGKDYSNACKAAAYGTSVERNDTCPGP